VNGSPAGTGAGALPAAQGLQAWASGQTGLTSIPTDWSNSAQVTAFINANEGARAVANNAAFTHIYNHQMTEQQRALFNEETARRNAATRQTEFNRALNEMYNEFDAWQRSAIGASIIPNQNFNPMLPPSDANPPNVNNPNYLFFEQWRDMMGLSNVNVEALYLAEGDEWAEHISNTITQTQIPFWTDLNHATGGTLFAALEPDKLQELRDKWTELRDASTERLEAAGDAAYNGKIYGEHRLGFLQGGYSERNAYLNSYASPTGAITGESFNDFMRDSVVGAPSAPGFTAAQRAAALAPFGYTGGAMTQR
jgi:hypothetical protein